MLAKASEGASMLAMASKRVRSAKWDDSETMLLANLKREAFLRGEEGSHVWQDISQTISGRSAIQCQRRWETLVKVYSHVQEYCSQTGQDYEELDDEELASMKLETAYRRDWYIIVEEVCCERKRRRICDRGAAAMLSKGSSTVMEALVTTRPATTDSSGPTAEMAARAYDAAVVCLRGPNASLNFPDSPPKALPRCISPEDVQTDTAAAAAASKPCTPLSFPTQSVAQALKAQLSTMETEVNFRVAAEESSKRKRDFKKVRRGARYGRVHESSASENFCSLEDVDHAWDDMKMIFIMELPPLEDLLKSTELNHSDAADYPSYKDCRSGPHESINLDLLYNLFTV